MKQVKFYELENGKEPVKEWLLKLDSSTRVKIIKRLERIYDDNFGDYKQIAPNLYELRFFFGKGYRIYYTIKNDTPNRRNSRFPPASWWSFGKAPAADR